LFAAENQPAVRRKKQQKVELFRGQIQQFAGAGRLVAGDVDFDVADFDAGLTADATVSPISERGAKAAPGAISSAWKKGLVM